MPFTNSNSTSNINNTSDIDKPISTATQASLNLKANQSSISNINNTSDLNKPVSTATQTGLNLKVDKEVPLFIFVGESNSEGIALNSSASSIELAIRPNLKIWNVTNNQFESLQIGTNNVWNNSSLFQTNKTLYHGWELELANRTLDRIGNTVNYVVKCGQGGSQAQDWDNTTDANYIEFVSRVTNAINAIKSQGFSPKIYVFQSLGINDSNSGTSNTSFSNSLTSFHANIRTLLGANTPIIMTQIMQTNASYIAINNAIKAINSPNTYNVDVTGLTFQDQYHWDYAGMKILANRLIDVAIDIVGLPNNLSGRKVVTTNHSFTTSSGNAITNSDVSKTIIRPTSSTTLWNSSPFRIESFSNVNKFGYGFYNSTNSRLVIGAVTQNVSNDDVELAPSATTYINNINVSGTSTIVGNANFTNGINVQTLTFGRGNGAILQNVASGAYSLLNNTTGNQLSGHGYGTLASNTTGIQNTAVGYGALFLNTTSSNNSAFGANSLYYIASSSLNNTAVGSHSAEFISNGTTTNVLSTNSVFIGAYTKPLGNSQENQIVIGQNATGNGTNSTVIGNISTTQTQLFGNLILSNSAQPTDAGFKLDVNGTARVVGNITAGSYLSMAGFRGIDNVGVLWGADSGGAGGIGFSSGLTKVSISHINAVADTRTSGATSMLRIAPLYNQVSSTASNTDLLVNRTETSIGSGSQRLIDLQVGGNSRFSVDNSGKILLATGVNQSVGTATLVAGTITVSNTSVTTNSRIFITASISSGTRGFISTSKVAGTSFTITSTSNTDTSVVDFWIIN